MQDMCENNQTFNLINSHRNEQGNQDELQKEATFFKTEFVNGRPDDDNRHEDTRRTLNEQAKRNEANKGIASENAQNPQQDFK